MIIHPLIVRSASVIAPGVGSFIAGGGALPARAKSQSKTAPGRFLLQSACAAPARFLFAAVSEVLHAFVRFGCPQPCRLFATTLFEEHVIGAAVYTAACVPQCNIRIDYAYSSACASGKNLSPAALLIFLRSNLEGYLISNSCPAPSKLIRRLAALLSPITYSCAPGIGRG